MGTTKPASHQEVTAENATTQYIANGANQIAYRTIGSGSPLIMVNRFRGTLDTWDPLFLDQLAAFYQVIWIDYSGIGYSTGTLSTDLSTVAADIVTVLNILKIKKAAVLGWSYGGLIAQVAALEHPELFSHAIIIGSGPIGRRDIPLEQAFLDAALKPTYDFEDEMVLFFEPESDSSRIAGKASHDRIVKRLDASKVPMAMETFQLYFQGTAPLEEDAKGYREQLKHSKVPMLALCGDHDISFAVEMWYGLSRKLHTTQLIVLPKTGHGPHHQFPELSARYIDDFIKFTPGN